MAILISEEILKEIEKNLEKSKSEVTIISAFCKNTLLEYLDSHISANVKKNLIVRLRMEDVLNGATDLELYPYCKLNGWQMYFRLDLHAKTYVFDNMRCVVGSANATQKGLSFQIEGNYEMACAGILAGEDLKAIKSLMSSSVLMSDHIYETMKRSIEEVEQMKGKNSKVTWPNEIKDLFRPDYLLLFTEDFPQCYISGEMDRDELMFLNIAEQSKMKQAFKEAKCYKWLVQLIEKAENQEMYFGAVTEALHNVLLNEPKPYRKDVKELLKYLLNWVEELDQETLKIDRPRHSQRIIIRENSSS